MRSFEKELTGIDIFKYIMALAVVAIHYGNDYPVSFIWFIRLAVPFFFITSGFFLARGVNHLTDDNKKVHFCRKRSLQILRLFGIWMIIYIPLSFTGYLMNGYSPWYRIPISMLYYIITRGEILYAWPLWFLYSLAIITFGIGIAIRYKIFRPILLSLIIFGYLGHNIPDIMPLLTKYSFIPFRALAGGIYILCGIYIYIS